MEGVGAVGEVQSSLGDRQDESQCMDQHKETCVMEDVSVQGPKKGSVRRAHDTIAVLIISRTKREKLK